MSVVTLPPPDSPVPAYAWHDRSDRMWRYHLRRPPAAASGQTTVSPIPRRVRLGMGNRAAMTPHTAAYGFPLQASTPRRARRHTVEFARRWGLDEVVEPAELLVSELMTNAFEASRSCAARRRHNPALAAAPLQLRLAVEHGRLRIEVRDHNPRPPVPDDPQPYEERGRGLLLVESFSHRWGYHRLPNGGKAVWCVVAPPSDDPTR
jgi:anti-sigma regulatory factor (Ser/Thr protein kinase)